MKESTMSFYQETKGKYSGELGRVTKRYNLLGTVRLLIAIIFLLSIYFYVKNNFSLSLYTAIASFFAFFYFIKVHQRAGKKRTFLKTLIQINEDEIAYLRDEAIPFEEGREYADARHAYSSDLDIFGTNSLFHHLNRTATFIGKTKLAELLSSQLPKERIKDNQEAVLELRQKTDWRQQLMAHAKISNDNREVYEQLISWTSYRFTGLTKTIHILSYLSPVIIIGLLLTYAFTNYSMTGNMAVLFFLFHITLANYMQKKAKGEMINTHKIDEIIKDYGFILQTIEQEDLKSDRLKKLKETLGTGTSGAGYELKTLSHLFSRIDNVQNLIGGIVLNGLFLYHIHTLKKITAWKTKNAGKVAEWLHILGEVEALNSIANFSYNNPAFVFPDLNDSYKITFKDLGHPLINASKRVCNSISFLEHRFIILTGSNMSGKSTFLRTLGVNMILTGIGAPVCATAANVHPLPVFVSMGQADSLADSESYFFAEVKRLKYIMDQLNRQACFILLDEILRGTNSDDKRNGTIGVIEKIIQKNVIGAIATHDLEVCLTTDKHPDTLINKCFEVEIVNNELVFDYQL